LQIGARTNGSTDAFTSLSPRAVLTPVPYALFAASTGPVPDAQLSANIPRLNSTANQNFSGPVSVTSANGAAQIWLNSGFGSANYYATLGIALNTNDIFTHTGPGDLALFADNGSGNFDINLNGSYAYQFTPQHLYLKQGGIYAQGAGTFHRGLTNELGDTYL